MDRQFFETFVRNNSAKASWNIATLNDRQAMLEFSMNSGRVQRLYITQYDSILEFSVASVAVFDCLDDIPHIISTTLLTKNAEYKLGGWCVEKIQGKVVYSLMQNVDINSVGFGDFVNLVHFLISECDRFDGFLVEVHQHISSVNSSSYSSSNYRNSFDWGSLLEAGVKTFLNIFIENKLNSWFDQYIQFDNFLFPVVLYIIQWLIF
ncbi:MAG: hypothetical protein F6K54_09525 [Okeania sp. SIO3B5]|uniref:hypothetical protein n=1 Tax=Okeania sp. SIO3B5 TaxID=2607811 RepID=UPI0014010D39|nr:hypothetical protein [Okeania sp. SIO3B5]NEO53298.1 hypothetical protein [Okeania sp. SIO3B5]